MILLHVEKPWARGKKNCSSNLGEMTKITAMLVYGESPSKILSETKGPLKL